MSSSPSIAQQTDLEGRSVNAINFLLDYWWVWLLALVALWLFLKARGQQKLLAELDERADAAYGDVDAMMAERHALLQNLANTVRSFAKLEKETIQDTLMSRVDALEALDGGLMSNNTQVGAALQNLFNLSEQYPTLASDGHYRNLRTDIIRIEEKLTASRKFYNLAVEEMNAVRRTFPASLFAGAMGVKNREKFSLGERRAELADTVRLEI